MSSTIELTTQNFDEVIAKPGYLIIDFWAAWCGPCKVMKPVFEALSADPEMEKVQFASVDVDAFPDMADTFGVTGIPAFFLLNRDGKGEYTLVQKFTGAQDGLTFKQNVLASIS